MIFIIILQSYENISIYANNIDVQGFFIDERASRRRAARQPMNYEKHEEGGTGGDGEPPEKTTPPRGRPRAGVNGGSAPDAARVIRIMVRVDFYSFGTIVKITRQQGWWVGMRL